jgi:hypothetical protein
MPRMFHPDSLPATPGRLFDIYLDSVEHAAFTGSPVTMGPNAGAFFRTLDGVLTGTILQTTPVPFDRSMRSR